jgi:beta-lactamase superfamily II metal-dependent hydrolase
MAKARTRKTRPSKRKAAAQPGSRSAASAQAARKPARGGGTGAAAVAASAPTAASPRPAAMAAPAADAPCRAKVRMYRQGLGDCFLISLKRSKQGPDYKILIDCGVILGTADPGTMMTKVVEDIVATTGGKIDLLLATHEHWDHLSGFIQAADSFKGLSVGEVWLAWTEDPKDALAAELRGERNAALAALQLAGNTMRLAGERAVASDDIPRADIVEDMLGFFGAAAGGTTADALAKVKTMAATVRYCRPADPPVELGDPAARVFVLGPPPDAKLIRRTLPSTSSPETYGLALDGSGVMPADVQTALADPDDDPPFGTTRSIPNDIARGMDFFRQYYWGPGEDATAWRSIDSEWLDSASDLALALDSATNNTSLVIAIELAGGDVLLFVADAQVGNWESWHDLAWQVDGNTVTGPNLLARTIFYKVGHHGSHNATLKENGLELMTNLKIAAIPVNHDMAVKKRWGNMPLPALVDALVSKTGGKVLRIDQPLATPIQGVKETDLYFEIAL